MQQPQGGSESKAYPFTATPMADTVFSRWSNDLRRMTMQKDDERHLPQQRPWLKFDRSRNLTVSMSRSS